MEASYRSLGNEAGALEMGILFDQASAAEHSARMRGLVSGAHARGLRGWRSEVGGAGVLVPAWPLATGQPEALPVPSVGKAEAGHSSSRFEHLSAAGKTVIYI
jgi:hypothetical protein